MCASSEFKQLFTENVTPFDHKIYILLGSSFRILLHLYIFIEIFLSPLQHIFGKRIRLKMEMPTDHDHFMILTQTLHTS